MSMNKKHPYLTTKTYPKKQEIILLKVIFKKDNNTVKAYNMDK